MGVLSRLALAQGYASTPPPGIWVGVWLCVSARAREVPKAAPWKSRDDSTFETLERAKHWTAFHVAQYIDEVCGNKATR